MVGDGVSDRDGEVRVVQRVGQFVAPPNQPVVGNTGETGEVVGVLGGGWFGGWDWEDK